MPVQRILFVASRSFLLFVLSILLGAHPTPGTARLVLLGDLNLGRGITPADDAFRFLAPYLFSADLALANLESPLSNNPDILQTEGPLSSHNLCTFAERARHLAEAGFDLLMLANNHALDCGAGGLSQTRAALESVGLTFVPPGIVPVYRQVSGIRMAFFALDDVSTPLDEENARQAIQAARQQQAQIVVSIHWGLEYQTGVSERQEQLAQELAQAGAVLIWGHHPHVLQPARWINEGKTLVLFSLGNALFDQHGLAYTRQSAMVWIEISEDGITAVSSVPFEIDVEHSRIQQAEAETAAKIQDLLGLK